MAEDRKFKFANGHFINRATGEAVPDDEPVMIFRARDRHALPTIQYYLSLLQSEDHREAVLEMIHLFSNFLVEHPDRMREPQA